MKVRYYIMLLALGCSPFGIGLHSQNVIRPKITCPNDIYVNSYNGVLFYQRADISIPNRSMPLEAVFYYNSSAKDTNYGYGNGWSLGCEYRYNLDSMGVTIESGDGRRDLYLANNAPGLVLKYDSPSGVFHKLGFRMEIINNQECHLFTLTAKDGTVYHFDDPVSKRVTQIKDRNNNVLNFTYDDGKLATISDGNGRNIVLTWADGMLSAIGTNLDDRQWHYSYDTVGNLVSVTNPMDYTVYYGYNRDNRINRFTDEEGYSTWISYNDDGMVYRVKTDLTDKTIRYDETSKQTIIVDYMGTHSSAMSGTSPNLGEESHNQFTTYRWDDKGRVIEKTGNCCGYTSKLEYDNDNNVIRSEDANGNVTTYTYDTNGNMLSMTDPMGYTESYTYEMIYNNPITFTDKQGHQYTFSYDNRGNPTAINGPLNSSIQITYNDYGQPLTMTDALNHVSSMGYDQYGNLISQTNALGYSVALQYNIWGNIVSLTSPSNASMYYAYDRMDHINYMTNPLGHNTSYSYNERGLLANVTDPLNNKTTLSYNALGQIHLVINPLNAIIKYTYNAKGKPTTVIDALNKATQVFYDDRDHVILSIDALGDSTYYQYDAVGNMTSVSLPNGQEITYMYDALGQLVQTADQIGVIQSRLYDAMGNVTAVINANGDTLRMIYDALGRMVQTTDPLGYSDNYTYDLTGNLLTHTDANGNTTAYTYDAAGQLLTESDAIGNVTSYSYTVDGQLSSVTDANGNTTAYSYDAAGQLTTIAFADGKTRRLWYDAAGNIIKQKDEAGNITMMTYDANGNLLSRNYPDGSSDQYTYDLNGNMLAASNANASVNFSYDANGQVISETLNNETTSYAYDVRNGTVNITYPNGRQVVENYDIRGRLGCIISGDTIAAYTYHSTDYVASRTYGNGDIANYTYDATGRLSSVLGVHGSTPILSLNYYYDNVGNILSKIDAVHSDRSEAYGYDVLHRLTSFKRGQVNNSGVIPNPLQQIQYALDALGNRTSVTANGMTTTYAHNNMNAYTTVGNEAMQYDGNGNLISDGTHTYQYNYRNRMVAVDNGNTATYQYDALDRRIGKVTAADTIHYYYRGVQAIEERSSMDTVTYVYGNATDDILSMYRNGQNYFYHKNHLGSVVAITDSSGALVETYEYDPYGTPTINNSGGDAVLISSIGNTVMFTGREYDYETGLYYYRARTLHPSMGRFMQHDPLMYVDGYNLFSYVGNMSTIMVDPEGEDYFSSLLGGEYGDYASKYYAQRLASGSGNMLQRFGYGAGLALSSLWNSETASQTLSILTAPFSAGISIPLGIIGTITNARYDDCDSWTSAIAKGMGTGLMDYLGGKLMNNVRNNFWGKPAFIANSLISGVKSYINNNVILGKDFGLSDFTMSFIDAGLVEVDFNNQMKSGLGKWRIGSRLSIFSK